MNNIDDTISRAKAIDALDKRFDSIPMEQTSEILMLRKDLRELPPAQLGTNLAEVGTDTISRQAAIDAECEVCQIAPKKERGHNCTYYVHGCKEIECLRALPPAQPERRCVNCGRTVNNGGWYEDGRTRCPIEEHYALPKDGYCHLWEKRKDWEDNYVKRAEEGEK